MHKNGTLNKRTIEHKIIIIMIMIIIIIKVNRLRVFFSD